jgi:hypothetical protein
MWRPLLKTLRCFETIEVGVWGAAYDHLPTVKVVTRKRNALPVDRNDQSGCEGRVRSFT